MAQYRQKSFYKRNVNSNSNENNMFFDIRHILENSGSESMFANGFQITSCLQEDITLPENATVTYPGTLTICAGATLTIPASTTLTITDGSASSTGIQENVNSDFTPQGIDISSTARLEYGINVVSQLSSPSDFACRLPEVPTEGKRVSVVNKSGFSVFVYPSVDGGSIDGIVNFGFEVPSNSKVYEFVCYENPNPGEWGSITTPGADGIRVMDVTYPAWDHLDEPNVGPGSSAQGLVFSFVGNGQNTSNFSSKNVGGSIMATGSFNPFGFGLDGRGGVCPDDDLSCDISQQPPGQSYIYNGDGSDAVIRPPGATNWQPFTFLTPSVRRIAKIKLFTNSRLSYVTPPNTGPSFLINTSGAFEYYSATNPAYSVTGSGAFGDPTTNAVTYTTEVPTNGFNAVGDNNPPINNQFGYASEQVGFVSGTFDPLPNQPANIPSIAETSANAGDAGTWYWEAEIPADWAGGRFDYCGKTKVGVTTSGPNGSFPGGDALEYWYFRCLNMKLRLDVINYPEISGLGYRPFNDMKFKLVFEVVEL